MSTLEFIEPDWPAPAKVRAIVTTRAGGVSGGRYASLNLATHVGDDEAAVVENRRRVSAALRLPSEPTWLEQVHGTRVVALPARANVRADASVALAPDGVCVVLVADCLPVVLASEQGDRVAVAHAGWRGLAAGVVEATVAALACDPRKLVAWLGPAIGPRAFEVGDEVRAAFVSKDSACGPEFRPLRGGNKWLADLPALARRRLSACGVRSVHGGDLCTHSDPARFYSYRRDAATGRMAALAWLA